MKREIECGCEILVYEDGSAAPEVVMCRLHSSAEVMKDALVELRQMIEGNAQEHSCKGYHCSRCYPALLSDVARKALETAGVKA